MSFSEVKRLMDDALANHQLPCSDIAVTTKKDFYHLL